MLILGQWDNNVSSYELECAVCSEDADVLLRFRKGTRGQWKVLTVTYGIEDVVDHYAPV